METIYIPDSDKLSEGRREALAAIAAGQLCLELEVSWGRPMSVPYTPERGMTLINL